MDLLNTKNFNDIVHFYDLERYISYFKLYNKSEYINSYHGYEHVKKIICSINELFNNSDYYYIFKYNDIKTLMIAAIFHDFNYIGIDKTIKNYDFFNVNRAINSFEYFIDFIDDSFAKKNSEKIKNIILNSEYPKCMNSKLDNHSKFFILCDHSMIIHKGYNYMGLAFSINEYKNTNITEVLKCSFEYIKNVHFKEKYFQDIWLYNKEQISNNFIKFVDDFFYNKHELTHKELVSRFNLFQKHAAKKTGNDYFEII